MRDIAARDLRLSKAVKRADPQAGHDDQADRAGEAERGKRARVSLGLAPVLESLVPKEHLPTKAEDDGRRHRRASSFSSYHNTNRLEMYGHPGYTKGGIITRL